MDQDVYTSLQDDKVIRVEQAGENNLRDIDVTIPRNQLIVVTGVSGSGKSSLASTRCTPRGNVAISRRSVPMPVSSWAVSNVQRWSGSPV